MHDGLAPNVSGYRWTDTVEGWTYEGREGEPAWVDAYTDASQVEIFVNGVSAGRSAVKDYFAKVSCIYEPGELMGIGYDQDGKELYRTVVSRSGYPDHCQTGPDDAGGRGGGLLLH